MTNAPSSVCPLCPLACDDLVVDVSGLSIAEVCSIVEKYRVGENRDGTQPLSFQAQRRPLRVVTTGVDLLTARELVRLKTRGSIELTIEADPSIDAMLQTISRDGIVSATLSEVATRSDSVWFFGEVESTWPRVLKFAGSDRLDEDSIHRKSQVTAEQLAELFPGKQSAWEDSKYAAVFIGPGAFSPGEEPISSAFLARLIRQRNQTSRCVGITLDQAATLRSVSLWSRNRSPESNGDGRQDIRIGTPMNECSESATIQVGGQDMGPAFADSYIATSVAGIHHASMVIRGDGSVSLPLTATIPSDLPTVAEVLGRIIGVEESVV